MFITTFLTSLCMMWIWIRSLKLSSLRRAADEAVSWKVKTPSLQRVCNLDIRRVRIVASRRYDIIRWMLVALCGMHYNNWWDFTCFFHTLTWFQRCLSCCWSKLLVIFGTTLSFFRKMHWLFQCNNVLINGKFRRHKIGFFYKVNFKWRHYVGHVTFSVTI